MARGCHEGYDATCGRLCTYPECMKRRHLSDPDDQERETKTGESDG